MPSIFFVSFFPLGAIFPYIVDDFLHLGVTEFGLLLTLPSLMSLIAAPLWGILADWLGKWTIVLRLATFLAALGLWIMIHWGAEFVFWGMLCYAIGLAPLSPITDALALDAVADQPEQYGNLRLWGSVGYMVGALAVSAIQSVYPLPAITIGWTMTLLFAVLAWCIPEPQKVRSTDWRNGIGLLLKNQSLIWILSCAAIHFSVHIANSNFLVMHLHSLELGNFWVGICMAAGIVVEVLVLGNAKMLLERWTARQIFQLAAGLAIWRWVAMALFSSIFSIVLTQATHGLSFGLFWIAAIHLVKEHTPFEARATGQSLLAAAVGGVGASMGIYIASVIVKHYDTVHMYWVSAFVALIAYLMSRRIR